MLKTRQQLFRYLDCFVAWHYIEYSKEIRTKLWKSSTSNRRIPLKRTPLLLRNYAMGRFSIVPRQEGRSYWRLASRGSTTVLKAFPTMSKAWSLHSVQHADYCYRLPSIALFWDMTHTGISEIQADSCQLCETQAEKDTAEACSSPSEHINSAEVSLLCAALHFMTLPYFWSWRCMLYCIYGFNLFSNCLWRGTSNRMDAWATEVHSPGLPAATDLLIGLAYKRRKTALPCT